MKKTTISNEAQLLLKLLRFALGTEPISSTGESFPNDIDWKEVIRLSYKHKVSSLAVDGLKLSGYDIPNDSNNKNLFESWFADVEKTEQSYTYYVEVLKTLCQIFQANGLKTIILKGYGLSLNYPIPSHRGAGDIDIFIIDKDGNPASDKGDQILRSIAKEHIEGIASHHTHFEFKGITIENHRELSNPKRKTKEELCFFKVLKELVRVDCQPMPGIESALLPSSEFNVLFQIQHIFNHFANGCITFRQLCDYYTFLKTHCNNVRWKYINDAIEKAELKPFVDGIDGLIISLIGASQTNLSPSYTKNDEIENNLYYDLFNFNVSKRVGALNVAKYYRNRWHHKFFRKQNWATLTVNHIINQYIKIDH